MADPPVTSQNSGDNGSNGGSTPRRWLTASGDILVAIFAGALVAAAFAGDEPAPYLFPRILAVLMLMLCALQIGNVLRGGDTSVKLMQVKDELRRSLPAVAVVVIYIACAERVGFYLAAVPAYIAFVLVGSRGWTWRGLIQAAIVGVLFTIVLYLVFAKLLYVQTPRGWWM